MTALVVPVLDDEPDLTAWLDRRRALGQDARDEVWEGVYHVAPHEHARNGLIAHRLAVLLDGPATAAGLAGGGSFNLGVPGDFRVPDLAYHREPVDPDVFMPTAALVVEVLSPGDETWAKLGFYASHGVDEVWVVDPVAHTVRCLVLHADGYQEQPRSGLLDLTMASVASQLRWP